MVGKIVVVTPAQHLEFLRLEAQKLTELVDRVDLDLPVPTCPEWSCRNVIQHLGGIHRWVASTVREGRLQAWSPDLEELCGGWPDDSHLAVWFAEGIGAMIECLASAHDSLECFSPLPAASPKAMWCRRQLHENTIHRIDLALAVGGDLIVDARVAADGVDELISAFISRRRSGLVGIEAAAVYLVHSIDTNHTWAIHSLPEGVSTELVDGLFPCSDLISGSAAAIYRVLWNRGTAQDLDDFGTGEFLGSWSRTLAVRYS